MADKAAEIADKARKSLGKYCYSECKAYCCRKGYLVLSANQARIVAAERRNELLKKKALTHIGRDKYVLDLAPSCPSLKDFKCAIHKNPQRPLACKDFPLFIEGKEIRLSRRCPAVKEQLMYPYLARLKLLGYSVKSSE